MDDKTRIRCWFEKKLNWQNTRKTTTTTTNSNQCIAKIVVGLTNWSFFIWKSIEQILHLNLSLLILFPMQKDERRRKIEKESEIIKHSIHFNWTCVSIRKHLDFGICRVDLLPVCPFYFIQMSSLFYKCIRTHRRKKRQIWK